MAESTHNTKTFRLESDSHIFEQSTNDIWTQITTAVRNVVKGSGIDKNDVKGIGFDATCSLAVTDKQGNAIQVTPGSSYTEGERNVILWADHRAEEEAKLINSTGSMVLNYVGKTMSVCTSRHIQMYILLIIPHKARDGNPQGALAQEAHACCCFLELHVL